MENRGGRGPRMDEYYGEERFRGRRDRGSNVSPEGGGSQYERYNPNRHDKDGSGRRFEQDPRFDNRGPNMEDRRFDRRGPRNQPIVESANGGGRRLERYDPRAHRMNGESRFEDEKHPRNYEQSIRDRSPYQREGSYNWEQPFFDNRRGNGRRGGRANNMNGMYRQSSNGSYSSGNSGRMITNDTGSERLRDNGPMRRDRMMDGPGSPMGGPGRPMSGPGPRPMDGPRRPMDRPGQYMDSNRDNDWWNGNPSGSFRDRQATRLTRERQEQRTTAERLKNGGQDSYGNQRGGSERRRTGPYREQARDDGRAYENEFRDEYNQGDRRRYAPSDYDRGASSGGRRWEDPYRAGDRTMSTETLNGPQRLDGGTRRQWTFDSNIGSVQLEMWTEGLPLMATIEIFEQGGQRKNSFDVYVEDGHSRPYSTVLDLPRQSGGTVLIRNDGPVEYPLVANVQPFSSAGQRNGDYQDRAQDGW